MPIQHVTKQTSYSFRFSRCLRLSFTRLLILMRNEKKKRRLGMHENFPKNKAVSALEQEL